MARNPILNGGKDKNKQMNSVPGTETVMFVDPRTVTLGVNTFVRRQTKASKFSYYDGSLEEVIRLAQEHPLDASLATDRDGVLYVTVPPENFFSGVVGVTPETQLRATFTARREGEEPFVQVEALGGRKLPAKKVVLVFYSREALRKDASTNADWELISINASTVEGDEPPTPMAMARNQLGLPGGSPAHYTSEQWAQSVHYWSTRAMLAG